MVRRPAREPETEGRLAPPAPPAPPVAAARERIVALQRSAGNAAVARSLLARDAALTLPGPTPNLFGGGPIMPKEVPEAVAADIRDYLQTRRLAIGVRVAEGSISMPEVVAMVRSDVASALKISPWQIEGLVREVMGRETPPPTRGKPSAAGATAEIEASIANAFPKPPTSVTLRAAGGSLELSVSGIEVKGKVAGANVTATADKEKGSVEAQKGGVSVGAEAAFAGDSLGLKTKVGSVSFGAKLQKENGTWSKWSMDLSVPLAGGGAQAATPAAELKETVQKAEAAVRRVVAHLHSGGSPTDEVVKKALEEIKPAIEGVSKAAEAPKGPAVSVGATASGGASGWSAGVSLIVTF